MHYNGQHNSSMLWMMLICALPLVILLFAGGSRFSTGYTWPIIIGVMIVVHIGMMFKGHARRDNLDDDRKTDVSGEPEKKNKKQHGGCCQ